MPSDSHAARTGAMPQNSSSKTNWQLGATYKGGSGSQRKEGIPCLATSWVSRKWSRLPPTLPLASTTSRQWRSPRGHLESQPRRSLILLIFFAVTLDGCMAVSHLLRGGAAPSRLSSFRMGARLPRRETFCKMWSFQKQLCSRRVKSTRHVLMAAVLYHERAGWPWPEMTPRLFQCTRVQNHESM